MRRLEIIHRTRYQFSGTVQIGPHRLLLRPRESHELRIESSLIKIEPHASIRWLRDSYDNSVAVATFESPAPELVVQSEVVVQCYDEAPLDFWMADSAVNYPFNYEPDVAAVLGPYLIDTYAQPQDEVLRSWIGRFWRPGEPVQTYSLLERLCAGIKQTFTYQAREAPGVQAVDETLWRNSGSCRDFAQLFMQATRMLGLAARFVSGYLSTGLAIRGATHAWVEVYLPGAGWKGFDPTLGEIAGNKHIPVAVARWPDAAPPVAGTYFGAPGAALYVDVTVTELSA